MDLDHIFLKTLFGRILFYIFHHFQACYTPSISYS